MSEPEEPAGPVYLDSSAIVRLYTPLQESRALNKAVSGRTDLVISVARGIAFAPCSSDPDFAPRGTKPRAQSRSGRCYADQHVEIVRRHIQTPPAANTEHRCPLNLCNSLRL